MEYSRAESICHLSSAVEQLFCKEWVPGSNPGGGSNMKIRLLKATLYLGALYYLIGSFVHFFGLTLFPWYDGNLYAPYHDTVIAFVAIVIALFLISTARDPIKNIDTLRIIIISVFAASIFSIAIIWKVDFSALGAPDKKIQTIVEGILGFVYTGILLWLYPKKV